MLRRLDHRIAAKTYFMNGLINVFNRGGEEEKAFHQLKDCLKEMLKEGNA